MKQATTLDIHRPCTDKVQASYPLFRSGVEENPAEVTPNATSVPAFVGSACTSDALMSEPSIAALSHMARPLKANGLANPPVEGCPAYEALHKSLRLPIYCGVPYPTHASPRPRSTCDTAHDLLSLFQTSRRHSNSSLNKKVYRLQACEV